jgi:HTH-type transcriptional repressor of NAD biosynthesis genes
MEQGDSNKNDFSRDGILKKTGLTLGKFAPFHAGHELLIETALSEVDTLLVMVYETDCTSVPLQVRAGWIKALYPQVTIIESWDGPPGYGNTPEIKRVQEEYIQKKLAGRKVTHFYSSEFYGEHVSQALHAVDRRVDEARRAVPVSGTFLRKDFYKQRTFLSDVVYRDLITKICFLGAPSTGKSTLAAAIAHKYNTQFMPEYGAEFWLKHHQDRRITLGQFEEIAPEHNRREDKLILESRDYLFCDTCPITTYVFAKDYHGQAGPILTECARMAEKNYDLFFLCDTDISYDDTWDRSGDQKRKWFQNQIIGDLKERKIPFINLSGDLTERIKKVEHILSRFRKFSNILSVMEEI